MNDRENTIVNPAMIFVFFCMRNLNPARRPSLSSVFTSATYSGVTSMVSVCATSAGIVSSHAASSSIALWTTISCSSFTTLSSITRTGTSGITFTGSAFDTSPDASSVSDVMIS